MSDENVEVKTFLGTIVFLKDSIGSKSEAVYPFVYINRNEIKRIFKKGDNPFENKSFDSFDGKYVQITGQDGRSGVFNVERITEIKREQ